MRLPSLRALRACLLPCLLLSVLFVPAKSTLCASSPAEAPAKASVNAPANAAADAPADAPEIAVPAAEEDGIPHEKLLPLLEKQPEGRVVMVLDGDTLRLADRRTIRLACIDAPDRSFSSPMYHANQGLREDNFQPARGSVRTEQRSFRGMEYKYAYEAYKELKKKALKQSVLLAAPKREKDPQGRLIADVILRDGTSLNSYLVANGLAYVVINPSYPKEYTDALVALQNKAIAEKCGFWDMLFSLEAARQPYTGNKATSLFYSGNDIRSQQIKPRLRVYFGTLMDAFMAGFAPASASDFWPPAK